MPDQAFDTYTLDHFIARLYEAARQQEEYDYVVDVEKARKALNSTGGNVERAILFYQSSLGRENNDDALQKTKPEPETPTHHAQQEHQRVASSPLNPLTPPDPPGVFAVESIASATAYPIAVSEPVCVDAAAETTTTSLPTAEVTETSMTNDEHSGSATPIVGAFAVTGVMDEEEKNDRSSDMDDEESNPAAAVELLSAQPVDEAQERRQARQLQEQERQIHNLQRSRAIGCWALLAIVLLAAIAVSLGVVLGGRSSTSMEGSSLATEPTILPKDDLPISPVRTIAPSSGPSSATPAVSPTGTPAAKVPKKSLTARPTTTPTVSPTDLPTEVPTKVPTARPMTPPTSRPTYTGCSLCPPFTVITAPSATFVDPFYDLSSTTMSSCEEAQRRGDSGYYSSANCITLQMNADHVCGCEPDPSFWSQLGQDLHGLPLVFGQTVSLSADGSILAVGARHWNDSPGNVRVFAYNDGKTDDNNWNQLGQDLDSEPGEYGISTALSADGMIVAFGVRENVDKGMENGRVRVFHFNSSADQWNQLGQDLFGEADSDIFGFSVDLSVDGHIVAVGATENDENGVSSGHVRVFSYNSDNDRWNQLGQDLDGEAAGDEFGTSVALSADGTTLAVGAHQVDRVAGSDDPVGGLSDDANAVVGPGYARVFRYNGMAESWSQLGEDVVGDAFADYFGSAVALSAEGTILAVSAPEHRGSGVQSGHVRVFEYYSETRRWDQLGQDLDGEVGGDWVGRYFVALSADGVILAAGAAGNDGNGDRFGHVRVFVHNSETRQWVQLGQDLEGEAATDLFGQSVALSADGRTVAAGAPGRRGGQVRVFRGRYEVLA